MTRSALTLAVAGAAIALAGCGLSDPYESTRLPNLRGATGPSGASSPSAALLPASREPATEAPDDLTPAPPVAAPVASPRPAATPAGAATRYAAAYTTWTADTYAAQHEQLVALTAGKLHDDLARSAPTRDQLGVLASQQQTNRGRVVSVGAPVEPRERNGERELYVITLEQAGSGGFVDPNQRHAAYRATVRQTPRGWLVSAWSAMP